MKLRDTRLWAVLIVTAFFVLWLAGVGVAYAAPMEEPLPEPPPSSQSPGAQAIGTIGWCLVGIGFLGVAASAALESRPRRRRRMARASAAPRRPAKVIRSPYMPPPSWRYRRNVERRF